MSDITPEYLTELRVYPESVIAKAECAIPVYGNDLRIFAEGTAFITASLNVGAAVLQAQAAALQNLSASVTVMRLVDEMFEPDEAPGEPQEEINVISIRHLDDDESTQRLLQEYIDARCAEDSEEQAA